MGTDAAATATGASPQSPADALKAALSCCGSDDLGDKALASSFGTPNRFYEDDDDDDNVDPGMLLGSKQHRSGMVLSALADSGGSKLTGERMAPLEGICVDPTGRSAGGLSTKCHLKQPRAFQRLFVYTPVLEPVLFFYLVTTVLRPLERNQAKTIAHLWTDEYGKTLTYALTKKHANDMPARWELDRTVWSAAVDWLCQLVKVTLEHGLDTLMSKVNDWDTPRPQPHKGGRMRNDPESELVAGLRRDRLMELLKATPTLVGKIAPADTINSLKIMFDR